jgi:hypothetical protein
MMPAPNMYKKKLKKLTAYAPIHVIISYAQKRCFLQVNTGNAAMQ